MCDLGLKQTVSFSKAHRSRNNRKLPKVLKSKTICIA